jgi:hypothetical protein
MTNPPQKPVPRLTPLPKPPLSDLPVWARRTEPTKPATSGGSGGACALGFDSQLGQ